MAIVSEALLHLAAVIDLKREKMESALTEARRRQLARQLDSITEEFRKEYFASGMLRAAAPPPPPILPHDRPSPPAE